MPDVRFSSPQPLYPLPEATAPAETGLGTNATPSKVATTESHQAASLLKDQGIQVSFQSATFETSIVTMAPLKSTDNLVAVKKFLQENATRMPQSIARAGDQYIIRIDNHTTLKTSAHLLEEALRTKSIPGNAGLAKALCLTELMTNVSLPSHAQRAIRSRAESGSQGWKSAVHSAVCGTHVETFARPENLQRAQTRISLATEPLKAKLQQAFDTFQAAYAKATDSNSQDYGNYDRAFDALNTFLELDGDTLHFPPTESSIVPSNLIGALLGSGPQIKQGPQLPEGPLGNASASLAVGPVNPEGPAVDPSDSSIPDGGPVDTGSSAGPVAMGLADAEGPQGPAASLVHTAVSTEATETTELQATEETPGPSVFDGSDYEPHLNPKSLLDWVLRLTFKGGAKQLFEGATSREGNLIGHVLMQEVSQRIDAIDTKLGSLRIALSQDEKELAMRQNSLERLKYKLDSVLEKVGIDYKQLPKSGFPNGLEGSYLRHISKEQLDRMTAVVGFKAH